jgi:arylsulfatase A-like enzyme
MNIVLVVFDSLRKDCIGCYNNRPPGVPPWAWKVRTPHLDALAGESLVMTRAYPESLPTLPTRRALYTGRRVYPFHKGDFRLKGDFVGAPGWGPIPEDQDTLAELLRGAGYRTALIADVYHMFKPSKNYWRGFDQWTFFRGQEIDPSRSGPEPTEKEIRHWLPEELEKAWPRRRAFIVTCLKNMYDRRREEDYFNARVLIAAADWLAQNRDAGKFFLVVECFDPNEPWFVPEHYRRMYDDGDAPEQVISGYADGALAGPLLRRTQANYSGLVTMCDRWFGHLYETLRVQGRLEDTLLIVTTDHGHSIGDRGYVGKRGYPSGPEVYDVPIFIRHPEGVGAGVRSDLFVQHTDLAAQVLRPAGVEPPGGLDGKAFFDAAVRGGPGIRDHVTVGWGPNVTVIDDRWWLNCKVDGTGVLLWDLKDSPFEKNVSDAQRGTVRRLFDLALADAGVPIPEFLLEMARNQQDAPGCSALAARE